MTDPLLAPTEVIAAAADRLAAHMMALRDAHEIHDIAPGPHDDLTSGAYTSAAVGVYRETLSEDYVRLIGLTYGVVVLLMDLVSDRQPERTTQLQWLMVRGYFAAMAERFAPDYEARLGELPSLAMVAQSTPPIVRFDLLAQLVSRAAVLRNIDAASWVSELVEELPDLADVDLSPAALAELATSRITTA